MAEEPGLVVTVKIDANRTEQIFIYEGDTAEDLAGRFCQEHGLPTDTRNKLIPLMDKCMLPVVNEIRVLRDHMVNSTNKPWPIKTVWTINAVMANSFLKLEAHAEREFESVLTAAEEFRLLQDVAANQGNKSAVERLKAAAAVFAKFFAKK